MDILDYCMDHQSPIFNFNLKLFEVFSMNYFELFDSSDTLLEFEMLKWKIIQSMNHYFLCQTSQLRLCLLWVTSLLQASFF